jgi:hypothetical protein
MKKNSFIIISQLNSPSNNDNQLSLPLASSLHCQKPQISSIAGISSKQRDRYRVMLGDEVLGDRLTLDEALELAKGGGQ